MLWRVMSYIWFVIYSLKAGSKKKYKCKMRQDILAFYPDYWFSCWLRRLQLWPILRGTAGPRKHQCLSQLGGHDTGGALHPRATHALGGRAGLQAWGEVREAGEGAQHCDCRVYGPLILQHSPLVFTLANNGDIEVDSWQCMREHYKTFVCQISEALRLPL